MHHRSAGAFLIPYIHTYQLWCPSPPVFRTLPFLYFEKILSEVFPAFLEHPLCTTALQVPLPCISRVNRVKGLGLGLG